jgi:2-iminobutanoate/2-iminopropanoate deaminase
VPNVETITPPNTPIPIGPYSHVATVGDSITIGGTAGVDPATGQLAGPDVASQTAQILRNFEVMLAAAGSDLGHVVHVDVYLLDIADFEAMNAAYIEAFSAYGEHRPARTAIGVASLPKAGAVVTMGLTAVVAG